MNKKEWVVIVLLQVISIGLAMFLSTSPHSYTNASDYPLTIKEYLGGNQEGRYRGGLETSYHYVTECGSYFDTYLIEQGYNPEWYEENCVETIHFVDFFIPSYKRIRSYDVLKNGSFGIQEYYEVTPNPSHN